MRHVALLLALLLAGCSASPAEPGADPTQPLYKGKPTADKPAPDVEIKHVPMDPVSGSVSAEGISNRHCDVVSGGGYIMRANTPWTFEAGSNATKMRVTATWTSPNPTTETLAIDFRKDGIFATMTGESGMTQDIDLTILLPEDRVVEAQIGEAACGGLPVAVTHYEGVRVNLDVEFVA